MRYLFSVIGLMLFITNVSAQKFVCSGGYIQDYAGDYNRQEFLCELYDLPLSADTNYGLESVVINIRHNRVSDLKITLEAPDGSNVWLTNRNGRDSGRDYTNTKFIMEATKYIHQAKAPFTGEYIPDGRLEYLNNKQNPNGYWKLVIEDLKAGFDGYLDSFSIVFGKHPAKIQMVKRCSFSNPELCVTPGKSGQGDLLPDLVILPSFTQSQVQEYAWNDSVYPGQLRFAATIANIGYGPMEIKGAKKWFCGRTEVDSSVKCPNGNNSRQVVLQTIYYKQGDSIKQRVVEAGSMYLDDHPGHNHFHIDEWVEFRLLKISSSKRVAVTNANKVSYCLFNSGLCSNSDNVCNLSNKRYGENMPNYGLGDYSGCGTEKQGIAVGGYDTYGMMYEGQFLLLPKGLKKGDYWLEIEVNPNNQYKESNKRNNTYRMKIKILKQE